MFGSIKRQFNCVRDLLRPKKCHFLLLPAELRVEIYGYVLDPFYFPPAKYSGLFLTCKLIKKEIEPELAKASTKVLEVLPWTIPPTQPNNFSFLTRIKLAVPRIFLGRKLKRSQAQRVFLWRLRPVFALHLRDLFLHIANVSEYDAPLNQLWHCRTRAGFYGVRNTRAQVGHFAVRLICLLCPEICHQGEHHPDTSPHCLLNGPHQPPDAEPFEVNVNFVALSFRSMDDWHLLYDPDEAFQACPAQDRASLGHRGWLLSQEDGNGEDVLDSPAPGVIAWLRKGAFRDSSGRRQGRWR